MLALAFGALGLLTRPLVAWDQVALRALTVGTNFSGYWSAAFDPDVRFVPINGSEVLQSEYAAAMVVHLVAPIVGALSLLVVIIGLVRRAGVSAR